MKTSTLSLVSLLAMLMLSAPSSSVWSQPPCNSYRLREHAAVMPENLKAAVVGKDKTTDRHRPTVRRIPSLNSILVKVSEPFLGTFSTAAAQGLPKLRILY